MHGRLKVKTTAEQQLEKEKERSKKLQLYNAGWKLAVTKRKNGENDPEALEVTGQLLLGNPDLYTMWNYRKEILLSFKSLKDTAEFQALMNTELSFTEHCLRENPKSYGSWQQRVWVLENMPEPNWLRELQLCNKYLELDERNFHVWDYRRYVVERCDVDLQDELKFSDSKISANFSNYSSWHYRSRLLPKIFPDPDGLRPIAEEKLFQELELVQNACFTDPNDQSAWFYHRWLMGKRERPVQPVFLHASLGDHLTVVVAFNRSVGASDIRDGIVVTMNNQLTDVNWGLPDGRIGNHSTIWVGKLNPDLATQNNVDVYSIAITYNHSPESQISCSFRPGETESWTAAANRWSDFSMELSDAATTILTAEITTCDMLIELEITTCDMLIELEPDSKWPLFTAVLLMKSLNLEKYQHKIDSHFCRLLEIDPNRKKYYQDFRSKIRWECEIRKLGFTQTKLNLQSLELTTFYHQEYFLQLTELDLSNNCIESLSGISLLFRLENLNVDQNALTHLDDLQGLTKLNKLFARNNYISDFSGIQHLTNLSSLRVLNLTGNSLSQEIGYRQRVEKLFPLLQVLDQ